MSDTNECLEVAAKVLWSCFLLGMTFLLVWVAVFFIGGDMIYQQGRVFGLSVHECNLIYFVGMGLVKTIVLVFFLIPHVAIRLVLRQRK